MINEKASASRKRAAANEETASTGGRETILREAAKLFSSKGFAESGLREIAQMAGIRSSSVYHHFASKERIYEEIIRIAVDAIHASALREIAALPANASPRRRIEAAIAGHLRALHSNKPFTSTNAQSRMKLPSEVDAVIRPVRDLYSGFWRKLLEDAARAGWLKPGLEPRMLRPLLLGTLNRSVGWFDASQGPVDKLIHTTIETFSGIWSKPPPARAAPKAKAKTKLATRKRAKAPAKNPRHP